MKKFTYIILSLIGIIVPYNELFGFLQEKGFDYKLFVELMFENRIASFFSYDVLISALVLLIFIILENIKEPVRFSWIAVIGLCLVGVSFALPLFLLLRELSSKKGGRGMLTYQANYNRL